MLRLLAIVVLLLAYPDSGRSAVLELFADPSIAALLENTTSFLRLQSYENGGAVPLVIVIGNTFEASNAVCTGLRTDLSIMLAFGSSNIVELLSSYSSSFHIPLISSLIRTSPKTKDSESYFLDMQPSTFGAVFDLAVKEYHWRRAIYLCDSREILMSFLDQYGEFKEDQTGVEFDMAMYLVSDPASAFSILNTVMMGSNDPDWHVILDVSPDIAENLIEAVLADRKLRQRNFHFVLASLDSEAFKYVRFRRAAANFTTLSLLNDNDATTSSTSQTWVQYSKDPLTSEIAVLMDSIVLGQHESENLMRAYPVCWVGASICSLAPRSQPLYCGTENRPAWKDGENLRERLLSTHMKGVSGQISFNKNGDRKNVTFYISEMSQHGVMTKVGSWNDLAGLVVKRAQLVSVTGDTENVLRVASVLNTPFLTIANCSTSGSLVGKYGICYHGYIAELLQHLAAATNYSFVVHTVPEYGRLVNGTEWDGTIGEILKNKADIVVADLSVIASREIVIDYTASFMTDAISILMKKPSRAAFNVFSFLDPFNLTLWFSMLGALIVTMIAIFFVGRLSPGEWTRADKKGFPVLKNGFTLLEASWSAIAIALSQSATVPPRSFAAKIVYACWFTWSLIVVASYTANLAAFLTISNIDNPIKSAADLVKQTEVSYGLARNKLSELTYFQNTLVSTYRHIWDYTLSHNTSVANAEEGIAKARNENFAFITQATVIEYTANHAPCDLMNVGSPLYYKSYAVAVPKASPLRKEFSMAILKLKEKGTIEMMRNKWFRHDDNECTDDSALGKQRSMKFRELAGIFIVLGAGLALALIVAVIEFAVLSKKKFFSRGVRTKQLLSRPNKLEMLELQEPHRQDPRTEPYPSRTATAESRLTDIPQDAVPAENTMNEIDPEVQEQPSALTANGIVMRNGVRTKSLY